MPSTASSSGFISEVTSNGWLRLQRGSVLLRKGTYDEEVTVIENNKQTNINFNIQLDKSDLTVEVTEGPCEGASFKTRLTQVEQGEDFVDTVEDYVMGQVNINEVDSWEPEKDY